MRITVGYNLYSNRQIDRATWILQQMLAQSICRRNYSIKVQCADLSASQYKESDI